VLPATRQRWQVQLSQSANQAAVLTGGGGQVLTLWVTVADMNDNSPVFPSPRLTVRVPESAAPGSAVPLPAAVDRDHGALDVSSYSLSSNATDRFRLHVTGNGSGVGSGELQLVVVARLDHETAPVYTATLTATDGGSPARSGSAHLLVVVQV